MLYRVSLLGTVGQNSVSAGDPREIINEILEMFLLNQILSVPDVRKHPVSLVVFQSGSVILALNIVIISAVSLFPKVRVVNKTLINPSASAVVQTGAGEGMDIALEATSLDLGPLAPLTENPGSHDLRRSQLHTCTCRKY